MTKQKYVIIKDTREQKGWDFEPDGFCSGMEIAGLKTGDYTLKGYEDVICIERKNSVAEIANNLGKCYKTFSKEIERMAAFDHAYIICEFSFSDLLKYPYIPSVPFNLRRRIKVRGSFLLKRITDIQLTTNVKILFCDNEKAGKAMAISLLKGVIND